MGCQINELVDVESGRCDAREKKWRVEEREEEDNASCCVGALLRKKKKWPQRK